MTNTITLPREVIEQAIDTIGYYASVAGEDDQDTPAKQMQAALRAALAQQAEPTHYLDAMGLFYTAERAKFIGIDIDAMVALYAAPQVAQPVREPLQDSLAWELWLNAVDTANNTGRLVAYTYKEAIERAHNIRGDK